MIALFATAVLAAELPKSHQELVERAERADLPAWILEQKALEGIAKGVDEARIATVLSAMLDQWTRAEQLLGDRAQGADRTELVRAAAAAMQQGAPPETVSSLARGARPVEALWTLSDAMFAGLSAEDAERLVRAALESRDPAIALRELPEAIRLLVLAEGPDAAARSLSVSLAEGNTPLASVTNDGPNGKAYGHDKDRSHPGHGGGSKAGGKSP